MKNQNTVWRYLAWVFVLSYAWQLVIYFTGGIDSILFSFMMLFPGVIAIIFRIRHKEGFRNAGWGLRRWWCILPVLLAPILFLVSTSWLMSILGWGHFSTEHFIFSNGMVEIQGYPLVLGNQPQSTAFFGLNFVLSLLEQSCLGVVVTFWEEFGWRGYVQEKLLRRFGLNGGLVLLGVIWGFWHLPIGLMGWNFPNAPVLGALVFTPISTIFIGIFLGWLYLRSKSIWMPSIAHAAWKLCATLLLNEMVMQRGDLYLQLTMIATWGVIAAVCLVSLNRNKPVLWQGEEKME